MCTKRFIQFCLFVTRTIFNMFNVKNMYFIFNPVKLLSELMFSWITARTRPFIGRCVIGCYLVVREATLEQLCTKPERTDSVPGVTATKN
jgi:hypothetical protein